MTVPLTAVRLIHRPDRADAWLRFGQPIAERRRGRDAVAFFAPDSLFAYVSWLANDYGTIRWTFCVARAGDTASRLETIPGVTPGAELLLRAAGKTAVKRALAYVDTIDQADIDPADVDPDHWRALANRFAARLSPRPFDAAAHIAARARREFAA